VKYFTPELLAEYRSSNPDVAEAAAAKWQARAAAYRERLQEIRHRLPLGVRRLVRAFTLHDAYLMSVHFAEVRRRRQFFLTFRLADKECRTGVQLRYDSLKRLSVVFHGPNLSPDTILYVLYDEFNVSTKGTVTHSILLTGGLEIRVQFANLRITRFTRVVAPAPARFDVRALQELAAG
jgi:hypothetical protein